MILNSRMLGIVTLVFSQLLTSCYFGNKVVEAPRLNPFTNREDDKISGYYSSQPESFEICANRSLDSGTKCSRAQTNEIPLLFSEIMTNPLAFIWADPTAGSSLLVGLGTNNPRLAVFLRNDLSLYRSDNLGSEVLWTDSNCKITYWIEADGALKPTTEPVTDKSTVPLNGRVAVNLRLTQVIDYDGRCDASLSEMYDCYLHEDACGGLTATENAKRRELAQTTFDQFIQAGAMTIDDIKTVTKLSYEVSYQ